DNDYKYVSFFSLDNNLHISLKGFKYNLNNYNLKITDPLCVSNEIIDKCGEVEVDNKTLVVLSKEDRKL
ncbi:MAG: hypothetical protein K6G28_04445, partial [Acholeplasmatales bacterium]|nr:hypothetical protein [Acholeplasmatales bacterium]